MCKPQLSCNTFLPPTLGLKTNTSICKSVLHASTLHATTTFVSRGGTFHKRDKNASKRYCGAFALLAAKFHTLENSKIQLTLSHMCPNELTFPPLMRALPSKTPWLGSL